MKKYTIIYINTLGVGVIAQLECSEDCLFEHLETIGIDDSQQWVVLEGRPKVIAADWSLL